ncbi:hypothetical protein M0R45_021909 [Rubus argutus]|uniref:KRR-R motif-containing protein 1 n=1 Tax=Rubus argutus TaxID=59490 RepID=A0AAW1XEG8_RUBAR
MENEQNGVVQRKPKVKGKHDKPKPWDDDPNIDRWKIEKFDPSWNEGGMLDVTSFSTLFPRYREKYLQDAWPSVKSALKEYGITCELNLVEGSMTVSTTRKTRDPYIIVKARDLIKLLSRSVPAPQAIKVLNDEMQCDIIKISNLVRSKEKFIKRRQRLIGPNSSTLKALEILTGCYILIQGNTTALRIKCIQYFILRFSCSRRKILINRNLSRVKRRNQINHLSHLLNHLVRLTFNGNWRILYEEAAFVPPEEPAIQDNKPDNGDKNVTALATSLKKKAKEYGKQKLIENVNPEAYLAESGESSKKKSKRSKS